MLLLGRKTAAERVAAFLLEMDERMQSTGGISLPMTRRDIGDYLGLTLETVSRALSQLKAEGTVELPTARQITVHRRSKLRDARLRRRVSSSALLLLVFRPQPSQCAPYSGQRPHGHTSGAPALIEIKAVPPRAP